MMCMCGFLYEKPVQKDGLFLFQGMVFWETSNVSILSKSMQNITSTFMEVKPMSPLPVGDCVPSVSEVRIPRRLDYEGEYIVLSPLDPEKDAPGLFACSHGTEVVEQLWMYMAYGPFEDVPSMQEWLEGIERSEDPLFFSVRDKQSDRRSSYWYGEFFECCVRCASVGTWEYLVWSRGTKYVCEYRGGISHALRGF